MDGSELWIAHEGWCAIHILGDIIDGFLIYNVPKIMDWKRRAIHKTKGIIDERSIYNIPRIMDCAWRVTQSIIQEISSVDEEPMHNVPMGRKWQHKHHS